MSKRTNFMRGESQEKVRRDHRLAPASGLMPDSAAPSTASARKGCDRWPQHQYQNHHLHTVLPQQLLPAQSQLMTASEGIPIVG